MHNSVMFSFSTGQIERHPLFVMDTPTHKHFIILGSQIQVNRYFLFFRKKLVCVLTIEAIATHKLSIAYACMPLRLDRQVSGIFAEGMGDIFL